MTFSVESFEAATTDESIVRGVHEAYLALEADFFPDDPAPPFEYHLQSWSAPTASHRKDMRFAAMDDGAVVGYGHAVTWIDHQDSGLITLAVPAEHRHQGIGTALFARSLDALETERRSKLIVDIPDGSPLENVAERLGLRRVLSEKINQLRIADIDWSLMEAWIEDGAKRAPDYTLLWLDLPIPDEHMANWCRISDVMNTAPIEDFDLEETVMTSEKWRSIESNMTARGYLMKGLVAVHGPTGDFAGMTTLMAQQYHPEIAQQDDTVVDPDHRGHGLGKLLKAAMAKRFLLEFPDVTRINTGNAGSNAPMLKINTEMGFKPILHISAWQGDIETARKALD